MTAADLSFRLLRAFTHEKRGGEQNEDCWSSSSDGLICAVSDGASVSFDPAPWARLLADRFVAEPGISASWLADAVQVYATGYDRDGMDWMRQGAFDRGSFATLLGVVASPAGRSARAFAWGDSLLAVVQGDCVVRTLPYAEPTQFDSSPTLLSTNPQENNDFGPDDFDYAWHDLSLDEGATLLLMTDALGRWLLDEPVGERPAQLCRMASSEAFSDFVDAERAAGRMRRDDTTLLVMGYVDELSADR